MDAGAYFHVTIANGQRVTAGTPCARIVPSGRTRENRAAGDPFAEWRWDGTSLRIVADRYGICPLFYVDGGHEFAVARSIDALLAIRRSAALDHDAVAAFLRLGFFLDEDTPFRAIRSLAPAASIEWQDGHLRVSTSRPPASPLRISRAAAIDGYVDLFRQAIARRLPDTDFYLPLSGGRDSRHMLFELARAGRRPRLCVTVDRHRLGYEDERDVARHVARAVGVEHRGLGATPLGIAPDRWAIRQQQYCSDEGGWYKPCADLLQRDTTASYDGIGGDMWAECSFNTPAQSDLFGVADANEIARRLLDYWRRDAYIDVLLSAPAYREMSGERAIARVAESVRSHQASPNPLASFYFWNRTRRKIALMPLGVLSRLHVHCPFLDGDLFDFVSNLPADVMRRGSFHTDVVARAFPELGHLPYSSAGQGRQRASDLGANLAYVAGFLAHGSLVPARRLARSTLLSPSLLTTLRKSPTIRFARRAMTLALYLLELEERASGHAS